MGAKIERPPGATAAFAAAAPGGLKVSAGPGEVLTLGSLPVGARLILRCRKDWRDASISAASPEGITLSVGSASGHTYRVRRPHDSLLFLDGSIPVLGEGCWRASRISYDSRW